MRRVSLIPTVLAIGGLALVGCGGGGGGGGTSSAPATTSGSSGGGGGKTVAVTMKNIAFAPRSVSVKVGQQVEWTNDDSVDHNVIATSGASFRSNTFGPDGTFSYTPTRTGTIDYVCTIHPGMTGTIVVTR